jgi:hypothetical protein
VILLDIPTTAALLHVPESTIRRWLSEGRLTKHGTKPYRVDWEKATQLADTLRKP